MADDTAEKEETLRREYFSQTALIPWRDLQLHYARGAVVNIAADMELVEVAVQLGMDNTARFQQWIDAGNVGAVTEEQALAWHESDRELWAVVAAPWVLVQDRA